MYIIAGEWDSSGNKECQNWKFSIFRIPGDVGAGMAAILPLSGDHVGVTFKKCLFLFLPVNSLLLVKYLLFCILLQLIFLSLFCVFHSTALCFQEIVSIHNLSVIVPP